MAEVTCPQCRTRQPIEEGVSTYRCVVCAATWNFVRCTVCGERYHTRPGTRAWTCPNCGTPHGRNRRGISRRGAPLPIIAAALVAVGVVAALAITLGSDDGAASPTPSVRTVADPADEVCRDLVDVQVLRVEALGRAAADLRDDASALRAAGDDERAALVDEVVSQVVAYQAVAEGGGDAQQASLDLIAALQGIDWC
jgi:hypothetical protein